MKTDLQSTNFYDPEITKYWSFNDFHSEFNSESHWQASMSKIEAVKKTYGSAWLGRINPAYDDDSESMESLELVEYTGQKIYNFGFDFVLPTNDERIVTLTKRWNLASKSFYGFTAKVTKSEIMVTLDDVIRRVDFIGGLHLHWT